MTPNTMRIIAALIFLDFIIELFSTPAEMGLIEPMRHISPISPMTLPDLNDLGLRFCGGGDSALPFAAPGERRVKKQQQTDQEQHQAIPIVARQHIKYEAHDRHQFG